MAREEKVWEYAIEAGYTPLEDRCIIVKGAGGKFERQDRPFLLYMRRGRSPDVRKRAHPAPVRSQLRNTRTGRLPRRSLFGNRIGEARR